MMNYAALPRYQTLPPGAGSDAGCMSEYRAFCPRQIIEQTVADVFEVEITELRQPTRGKARVSLARQVCMYMAHISCGLNLTDVGELFARDRTTVAHACALVEQRRDGDEFNDALDLVELIVRVLLTPRALRSTTT